LRSFLLAILKIKKSWAKKKTTFFGKGWDRFVPSKTVTSNFCPKHANKLIEDPGASIFERSIAILTWPNLTGLNRPFSPFFNLLALPGYSAVFLNFEKQT
jgi:hypothetical protein